MPATAVQNAPRVRIMPATITAETRRNNRKLRVAAYCRVSTDDEDQLLSYEVQVKHYTSLIEKNPEWKCAGIFADEGISGMRTKKRDDFNKMVELCRAGKIDRILTKSISRFARNTLDTLYYVREFKALGISIMFEKENIDTLTNESEMMITILSAFAQAESESISGNIKLGKRFKFKAGEAPMMYGNMLGYRKGSDGKPEIIPEDAEIIKFIFKSYLDGYSYSAISVMCEERGYKTKKGNSKWSVSAIRQILSNEKFKGDVRMQKTFVTDIFNKTTKRNVGELPMYIVEGNHTPIIEPEMFDRVQVEMARRSSLKAVSEKTVSPNAKYCGKFALTGLVECGDCGRKYRRTTWSKKGKKKVVWRCINRLDYGTKYCEKSPSVLEEDLHNAVMSAINSVLDSREDLRRILYGTLAEVINAPSSEQEIIKINDRIEELNKSIIELIANGVAERNDREEIEMQCKERYKEVSKLQEELNSIKARQQLEGAKSGKGKEALALISSMPMRYEEYDDEAVRKLVSRVKIISENEAEITLMNTVVLSATLKPAESVSA